jgi:glycosyltransferase involved in cell wall biosynthesis
MLISVLIRNKNELKYLRQAFAALRAQTRKDAQIVLVDNQSTDGSVSFAREAGATIVSIERFGYGAALNVGMRACTGDVVVILSAHSIPLGPYFLDQCARPFETDPQLAAARLVYVGKGADAERWIEPEIVTGASHDYFKIQGKLPLASGCVVRRSVWEQLPFDEFAIMAEEKIWAFEALRLGYKIQSPVPAFYLYVKRRSVIQSIRQNHWMWVAGYCYTKSKPPKVSISNELRAWLGAIRRGVRHGDLSAFAGAIYRTYLRWRLPRDVRAYKPSADLETNVKLNW